MPSNKHIFECVQGGSVRDPDLFHKQSKAGAAVLLWHMVNGAPVIITNTQPASGSWRTTAGST